MKTIKGLLIGVALASSVGLLAQQVTFPPAGMPGFVIPASGMNGAGTVTAAQGLFPDGTSAAPSIAFANQPALGFYRAGAGSVVFVGSNGILTLGTGSTNDLSAHIITGLGYLLSTGGAIKSTVGDGLFSFAPAAQTLGTTLKVDALPSVSACGAGSPAVTAGSTPLSGSVTIGTTAVATCLITFNGTAYPSAAHCSGSVETTTAANVRAMGYLATTTTLTIVPTAAWADSSVVNWSCYSPK